MKNSVTQANQIPKAAPAPKTNPALQIKYINPLDDVRRYPLTDLGAGYLFADTYKNYLRFVTDNGKWFFYDGIRWQVDIQDIRVNQCAKELVTYLDSIDELTEFVEKLSKQSGRKIMINDARSVYPLSLADFDTNVNLINCLNCTYDLLEMKPHPHRAEDLISKVANVMYDPNAKCERFVAFIDQVMCGDSEISDYLQKSLGYILTGDTSHDCMFIFYGPTTRNGKGTLIDPVYHLMNDYAKNVQPNSLAKQKTDSNSHSSDIARLVGARFVNASELPDDLKLNAALVKQLTGGDMLTVRNIYGSFFEYKPQFKIFINTNHLPEITDDTLFSSGRLKLIPFDRHFSDAEQDRTLKSTFREPENVSAIFNWQLEGYARFRSEGLAPPKRVEELLLEYRKDCDSVKLFIDSCMVEHADAEPIKTKDVHFAYVQFCKNQGIRELALKTFVQTLRRKNLVGKDRIKGNVVKGYILQ